MRTPLLCAAALLAGCVTTEPQYVWQHREASQERYDVDTGQCKAQAFQMPGSSLQRSVIVFESCMQGKGWQRVPVRR
jgi:hypothetical protein